MKITYLGTTVLLFDDGETQVLFDAHVTRPSILKYIFTKFESNKNLVESIVSDFEINRLKSIFISHSHADHVLDAPNFSKITGTKIYGSKSAINVAIGGGVNEKLCNEFCHGDEIKTGDFKIKVIKSLHSKAHWYNNDLGKTIDKPLIQPARKKDFKEGGSYDFYVENRGQKFIIRPSCNYIENQLNGLECDCIFLGIAGITGLSEIERKCFFAETVEKTKSKLVIPLHWDNFFASLQSKKSFHFPKPLEQSDRAIMILADYCSKNKINCLVQPPLTSVELN